MVLQRVAGSVEEKKMTTKVLNSAIFRRIGQAVVVLFLAFTVSYVLLAALPGDSVTARYGDPNLGLSPDQLASIRESYGADQSAIEQYVLALKNFLTGHFGYSVTSGAAVVTLIGAALPGTLALAAGGIIGALIFALVLTWLAALAPARWVRQLAVAVPSVAVSLPSFLVGILLIQWISFQWHLVPVIGASGWQQLILPIITLALPIGAPLAQVLIRSMLEVNEQPFITVVISRGASGAWVFWHNTLRNAALPVVTMAGLLFGELIGGAVVTEAVFGRTGIGTLTVSAVQNRDTPILLAIVVLSVVLYVVINLVVDLLYPLLDPRLRATR